MKSDVGKESGAWTVKVLRSTSSQERRGNMAIYKSTPKKTLFEMVDSEFQARTSLTIKLRTNGKMNVKDL